VLYKGKEKSTISVKSFVLAQLSNYEHVYIDEFIDECFDEFGIRIPNKYEITEAISKFAYAHSKSKALCYGGIEILHLTNKQIVYQRQFKEERIIVLINADCEEYTAHYNANAGCGTDIISGEMFDFGAGSKMPPYCVKYIKVS
jgi:hypothetical protein